MRYSSFTGYFKQKYGCRLQKVVIDAGFTCPNRDGACGLGGCTYCDNAAFHPSYSTPDKSISQQIDEGIGFHKVRYRRADRYLAYFQPYSNTYAPVERLRQVCSEALAHPDVCGVVLGTRPDCIDEEKLHFFSELSKRCIVMLEYGIESCYDSTLLRINRGHDFQCAVDAVNATSRYGIEQCAHIMTISDLASKVQVTTDDCEAFYRKGQSFIVEGAAKNYLVHIYDKRDAGDASPYEYVESKIRETILSKRKQDLLSTLERDLLNDARNTHNFKIYKK